MQNNKKADSWRKTLKLISHCPVCGRDYKSEAAKLFDLTKSCQAASVEVRCINESDARFVHFTCAHCQSHFMAMVMMMPKGISTVGMVTDLNLKDVQKLYKMSPLTIDETIEAHKFINSSNFNKNLIA
jgi:hypothetical protein